MHAERTKHQIIARSTSGATLELRYDTSTNSVIYVESGWTETGREALTPRGVYRQHLRTAELMKLRRPGGH